MIKGRCKTNLDEYRSEEWPCIFGSIPNKGDLVESRKGRILRVVQVTHKAHYTDPTKPAVPFIIVELHEAHG